MKHVIVSGFARRIIEFRGRDREWFPKRTLILLDHAHANGQRSLYDRCSSMRTWISFRDLCFYFTFVLYFLICDLENLEITSRKGPANCYRREQLPMTSHPLDHLEL